MSDNTGAYIAQGLVGLLNGYNQGTELKRKKELEDRKMAVLEGGLTEDKLGNITKEFLSGLERDGAGGIRVQQGFLDPESDIYRAGNRRSELKALESPKATATASPLSIRQAHSIRGLPLPKDLEAVADQPFDHRYINLFNSGAKTTPTMRAKDLYAMQGRPLPEGVDPEMEISSSFIGALSRPNAQTVKGKTLQGLISGNIDPNEEIPTSVASLAAPKKTTNSQQLATAEQRATYEKLLGLPAGSAEGFTVGQIGAGLSTFRAQQAAGDRQAKALGQSARQFDEKMDFESKKDLESRLEKFRDDYAKTGIPTALPIFEKLDKLTGIVSGEKPNLSKLPGVTTNTLRSLPLIGNAAGSIAAKRYGGGEEYQLLQKLLNADIRNLSGQAVTKYEEGRTLVASGMGPGANEKDVVRGVRLMYDALKGADQDVRAAYPVEVVEVYESRGGNKRLGSSAPNSSMNPSEKRAQDAAAKKLGISKDKLDAINAIPNPPGQSSQRTTGGGAKVAKKLYSPSRNQTKIVYEDGREEVVNGKK